MKIAIDESPLVSSEKISHRVRGVGYYLKNLKDSLLNLRTDDTFVFFRDTASIPHDATIIHYPYFEPFFITLPIFDRKKIVVTVHDLTPLAFPENFPVGIKGRIKWEIQKLLLRRTSRIITDSIASQKDIARFTGISESKIDVIYLASSTDFRPISNKKELSNVQSRFNLPDTFLLYVGDVTWNKNLPRLIEAVKIVGVPLVLVGKALTQTHFDSSNPWNQDLLKVNTLIRDDPLFIRLGFVSDQDLPYIYNLATVFTMPSLYEGFGLPLLEAMGSGVPVVTSQMGSIPEVVGDAAQIVDPYDVRSIASGIEELLKNPKQRDTLRERGFKQVGKFSWKKTAEETYETYKKVANK